MSIIPLKEYDKETRELLNLALQGLLSHYGHPFSFVTMAFKIDSDPVELLQTAPGITQTLVAAGHLKKGTLLEQDGWVLATILDHLVSTLARARSGDEFAGRQIQAVGKLLEPEKYDLPMAAIDELLDKHHTRAPLARGWALRSLMGKLSWGVEPSQPGMSVLEGTIRLTSNERLKGEKTYWKEYGEWRSAYEVALEHWPKRGAPTLKSLAIKVYLRQLSNEGFTNVSEGSLEKDLRELEEWDKTHAQENKRYLGVKVFNAGGDPIHLPWQEYSEGWKLSGHYEHNKEPVGRGRKRGVKSGKEKGG